MEYYLTKEIEQEGLTPLTWPDPYLCPCAPQPLNWGLYTIYIPPTPLFFFCTDPSPLKIKCDNDDQVDSRGAFLWKVFLAPLPSCVALVQLVILLTPYMISFVKATIYMRGLSRPYNAGKTYGQVRLGKTNVDCPLVGDYNNFPRGLAKVQRLHRGLYQWTSRP